MSRVDSRTPSEASYFQYSGRDKLVQVTQGTSGTVLGQFDYNYDGNRIRHRFSDRGNVDYFYDDGSVLVERNADDNSLLAHYQYADRLIALAQPLGKQYYHHDALGSTIGLTDSTGADKKSYRLDPWGNIRAQSGTSDNRHIFTGQEHDPNTGLVYFGARYYDPEVGRFLTQDTYLGEANRPPSLHRYLYARSNPCRFIDPDGHKDKEALEKGIRSFNWVLRSFDSWLDNQVVTAPFAYNISGTALMPTVSRVQTGDFFGDVLANTAAGIYNLATIPANAFGEVSSLPKRALMGVGMDEIDANATLVSSLMLAPMGGQFKAPWMRGIKTRLKLDFTKSSQKNVGVTVEKLRPVAGKSSQAPARPSPSSVLKGIADRLNPANYRPDLAGLNMGVRLKYVGPKVTSSTKARMGSAKKSEMKVRPGDRGNYTTLKKIRKDQGQTEPVEMHEMPSYAAKNEAFFNKHGHYPRTPADKRLVRDSGVSEAVTPEVHAKTRTYRGKNTRSQVQKDAADLDAAQRLDEKDLLNSKK